MLDCFSAERQLISLRELADQLDTSVRTAHAYASVLASLGFLERVDASSFKLGARVADLGLAFLTALPVGSHSLSSLRELRDTTGHTASLAIIRGTQVIYVNRVRGHSKGQYEIDLGLKPGDRLPISKVAAGKVLLAYLSEPEQHAVIADVMFDADFTGDKAGLRRELAQIRSEGLAVSEEDLVDGLRAVAAPVRDSSGDVIGAVELGAPIHGRTRERFLAEVTVALLMACSRISELLAGH